MFPRGLSGPKVRAGHLARLEAVASAGGGARRPRADAPAKGAGLRGAVLQGAGPSEENAGETGLKVSPQTTRINVSLFHVD